MNTHTQTFDTGETRGMTLPLFLCGAALGAVAALILAPSNGRDTRAYLKRRSNELGRDAMSRSRDTWRTQSSKVKSAISSGWERAGSALQEAREQGEATYRETRDAARQEGGMRGYHQG